MMAVLLTSEEALACPVQYCVYVFNGADAKNVTAVWMNSWYVQHATRLQ